MTCPACFTAEHNPLTDAREPECLSCRARIFVLLGLNGLHPGQAHQAMRKQFGEQIGEGKELVDKWSRRVRQARAAKEAV